MKALSIFVILFFSLVRCSGHSERGSGPALSGGSSGGGGYDTTKSAPILRLASQELATLIRNSSPDLYTALPYTFQRESLADLIEQVNIRPLDQKFRDGQGLFFDYSMKPDGKPQITALEPFFVAYGSVSVEADSFHKRLPYADAQINSSAKIRDIQKFMLHEADHPMHNGENLTSQQLEDAANKFSANAIEALRRDFLVCHAGDTREWQTTRNLSPASSLAPSYWIYHLPTMTGIFVPTDLYPKTLILGGLFGDFDSLIYNLGYKDATNHFYGKVIENEHPPVGARVFLPGREQFQEFRARYNGKFPLAGRFELQNAYPGMEIGQGGEPIEQYFYNETLVIDDVNITPMTAKLKFSGDYPFYDGKTRVVHDPGNEVIQAKDIQVPTVIHKQISGSIDLTCEIHDVPIPGY